MKRVIYIFDEYKGKIKLIVSGSSAFYIDQKFKDSLAGRKLLFELNLLNFREFLYFKGFDDIRHLFTRLNYPPELFGQVRAGMCWCLYKK